MEDGSVSIFLSTRGRNAEEVPAEMVRFLEYVKADLEGSTQDFGDEFVESLQRTVAHVKQSREMGERFMLTELIMQDERRAGRKEGKAEGKIEGKAEALLELLEERGFVPEKLKEQILEERDLSVLNRWFKLAIKAGSLEQFVEEM